MTTFSSCLRCFYGSVSSNCTLSLLFANIIFHMLCSSKWIAKSETESQLYLQWNEKLNKSKWCASSAEGQNLLKSFLTRACLWWTLNLYLLVKRRRSLEIELNIAKSLKLEDNNPSHCQEEEWCEASLEVMVSLISSEFLRVDSEYQVHCFKCKAQQIKIYGDPFF